MEIDIITLETGFEYLSAVMVGGFCMAWIPWFIGMIIAVFKKIVLS